MQRRWLSEQILENLIYKCDLAYRQLNLVDANAEKILFKLNLQLLSRLRLIKPVRDLGNAGPLRAKFDDGEYHYAIEDVNRLSVTTRSHLAIKHLLPARAQAVVQANDFGEVLVFYHAPNYRSLVKQIYKGNFCVQFAQGCLQYSKQLLFNAENVNKNVKG